VNEQLCSPIKVAEKQSCGLQPEANSQKQGDPTGKKVGVASNDLLIVDAPST